MKRRKHQLKVVKSVFKSEQGGKGLILELSKFLCMVVSLVTRLEDA